MLKRIPGIGFHTFATHNANPYYVQSSVLYHVSSFKMGKSMNDIHSLCSKQAVLLRTFYRVSSKWFGSGLIGFRSTSALLKKYIHNMKETSSPQLLQISKAEMSSAAYKNCRSHHCFKLLVTFRFPFVNL